MYFRIYFKMTKRVVVSVSNDLSTDQRVHKVCTSLLDMGFDVLLIGRKFKNSQDLDRKYSTKRFSTIFRRGPLFYLEFNIRLFFILLLQKSTFLLSNDLDTLAANFLASKFKKSHLVYDSHELFPEAPELVNRPFKKKIWESLEKFLLTRVNTSYTVCDSIANFYHQKYGINMKVVRNVPFLKDVSKCNKDSKSIIYQGNLNPGRGLELAIRSMQFLPDFKFTIIGGGQEFFYLNSIVDDLGINDRIDFLGKLPFHELKSYTDSATIGLLLEEPLGLSFEYSLPNKLFDYIHSDVAVVASPLIEVKKIMDAYKVGELVANREPEQLALQIKRIAMNHNSYEFLSAKSCFNWQLESKAFLDVFRT
jgi:glycosyltransferase involved in cell wall biosynthesis